MCAGEQRYIEVIGFSCIDWTFFAYRSIMGKKGKTTENTNQKLGLAIKSGKHRVGKYNKQIVDKITAYLLLEKQILTRHFLSIRLQGSHEDVEKRTVQTCYHFQQLPRYQKDSARVHGHPWRIQGAPLRW